MLVGQLHAKRFDGIHEVKPASKRRLCFRQDENLVVTVWQDIKPVLALSTNWDPTDKKTVTRKQKDGTTVEVTCPTVIDTYNNNTGGVNGGIMN